LPENTGRANDGPFIIPKVKMQHKKTTKDQIARRESVKRGNNAPNSRTCKYKTRKSRIIIIGVFTGIYCSLVNNNKTEFITEAMQCIRN